eukprot:COSAG02_NODE_53845_length_299_cov_0.955000_1_plen_56_part_10
MHGAIPAARASGADPPREWFETLSAQLAAFLSILSPASGSHGRSCQREGSDLGIRG